ALGGSLDHLIQMTAVRRQKPAEVHAELIHGLVSSLCRAFLKHFYTEGALSCQKEPSLFL
ncbi:MAG: hypothetical protein J6K73_09910, partial [Clostridia bacterium]|nr:hypothetical protein [Clostridia bacterium]